MDTFNGYEILPRTSADILSGLAPPDAVSSIVGIPNLTSLTLSWTKPATYNNTTMEYIDDKLKLLAELEEDDDDKKKDYRKEVNNLCLYLKQEIETGSINMGETKNSLLINLINEKLGLLSCLDENINWEEEINILNKRCEEIYNYIS